MTRWLQISVLTSALVLAGFVVWTFSRDDLGAPTEDASSSTSYYIPYDLTDALQEFDRILGERGRNEVIGMQSEDEMVQLHFGLGMWIRNNWGLWSGSRLSEYFNGLGIYHPDDMSGIILDSYWRQVHGQPIDLEAQVTYYIDYWERLAQ